MQSKVCVSKRTLILGILVTVILSVTFIIVKPLTQNRKTYNSRANDAKSNNIVVGGTEVTDPFKWPFMVRITIPVPLLLDTAYCDGTLIEPQWVLTSGHCISDEFFGKVVSVKGVRVLVGSNDLGNGITKYKVSKIYRHPNFLKKDDHHLNDIALLYLSEPVIGVVTITLNEQTKNELEGTMSVVVGWGITNKEKFPRLLNQGVVPILSNQRLNKSNWYKHSIDNSEIAAGYPKGGVDACTGDSGGPILVWTQVKWVQVGVISWKGGGCGAERHPGINTRVSFVGQVENNKIDYIQWIKEIIEQRTGNVYTGQGTFIGSDLTQEEKKEFIKRIWINCELQHDDGQPC